MLDKTAVETLLKAMPRPSTACRIDRALKLDHSRPISVVDGTLITTKWSMSSKQQAQTALMRIGMVERTGRAHLDWCIARAMEYANAGELTLAWASFISDVRKHPETAYIGEDRLTAQAMVVQSSSELTSVNDFRNFITAFARMFPE
jgi:hypothetical protein